MTWSTFKQVLAKRKTAGRDRERLKQTVELAKKKNKLALKVLSDRDRLRIGRQTYIFMRTRFRRNVETTEEDLDLRLHLQKESLKVKPRWSLPAVVVRTIFWGWCNPTPKAYIKLLPHDVIVDNIVPYLTVEDILRFRTVDKQFYILLHNITIWRRLFRNMYGIRLPILRPTFDPLKYEQSYEIEQLVRRSITLEREWRRGTSRVRHATEYRGPYNFVDVFLVPGGKFLVASAGDNDGFRFYLMLFALDVVGGLRLVSRLLVSSAPTNICAAYGTHNGIMGLYVNYTLTTSRGHMTAQERIDLMKTMPHCIKDDLSTITVVWSWHFDLETAEEVLHPSYASRTEPFNKNPELAERPPMQPTMGPSEWYHQVSYLKLFRWKHRVMFGFSTLVDRKPGIVMWDAHLPALGAPRFDFGFHFTDSPAFQGFPHQIRAWTFCPWTEQLFVVRTASVEPGSNARIFFEFYDLSNLKPNGGIHVLSCTLPWSCRDTYQVNQFTISDSESVVNRPTYANAPPHFAEKEPPAIYVFGSVNAREQQGQSPKQDKKGTLYWVFRAEPKMAMTDEGPHWTYRNMTQPFDHFASYGNQNSRHDERVLAGVHRTLVVEVDEGIKEAVPIRGIKRFKFNEAVAQTPSPAAELAIQAQTIANPFKPHIPTPERNEMCGKAMLKGLNARGGVKLMKWDEGSGKIAILYSGKPILTVLDLGENCEPLERLAYVWQADMNRKDEEHKMEIAGLEDCTNKSKDSQTAWANMLAPVKIQVPAGCDPDLSF